MSRRLISIHLGGHRDLSLVLKISKLVSLMATDEPPVLSRSVIYVPEGAARLGVRRRLRDLFSAGPRTSLQIVQEEAQVYLDRFFFRGRFLPYFEELLQQGSERVRIEHIGDRARYILSGRARHENGSYTEVLTRSGVEQSVREVRVHSDSDEELKQALFYWSLIIPSALLL